LVYVAVAVAVVVYVVVAVVVYVVVAVAVAVAVGVAVAVVVVVVVGVEVVCIILIVRSNFMINFIRSYFKRKLKQYNESNIVLDSRMYIINRRIIDYKTALEELYKEKYEIEDKRFA
jgi:hypothetical protein